MAKAKNDVADEISEEPVEISLGEGFAEDPEAFFEEVDEVEEVDSVETLRVERDNMRDRFMRALADAENSRKRGERDRREAEQYGGAKLARDILPVYDNLKRALETVNDEQKEVSKALIEGVELTMREVLSVFKKHGIDCVSPKIGDRFDPQNHQAMFEAALPDTKSGDIIQVMAEGFMLHDRLLRPAQVGVSSTPAKKAS
ncbi:MAG: nucleotide exchange factor GrpE [Paracoccaceae bacterium]